MGVETKIQWTDHTFNPWWGCARVSPGCEHCYAETFAKRTGKATWGRNEPRRFFGDKHWEEPLRWNEAARKAGTRAHVFCASMADVFEDRADLEPHRDRLWELIRATPHLDWLLLTKRPENLLQMLPWTKYPTDGRSKPWPNVWIGTTCEDQRRAEERLPLLLAVACVVRFVSAEPLLSELLLRHLRDDELGARWDALTIGLDWVIVGGESGPGARPFNLGWARRVVDDCRTTRVACFVKQLGAVPESSSDDDRRHCGDMNLPRLFRLKLADRKGGNLSEWPEDLQVRELPTPRVYT